MPVLFGGCVSDRSLTITGHVGTRSNILRNLRIDAECGLGGRAIAEQRPGAVQDYANSSHITHDYDYEVGTEAIESLMAVPIVVRGGVTRGAIYGGLRANLPIGDVIAETMMRSSYALAREFEIRDEVDRRVAMLDTAAVEHGSNRDAQISEGLTESVLALGEIAANLEDMALSAQVLAVEAKLRALASPKPSANTPVANTVVLSPREREVMGVRRSRTAQCRDRREVVPERRNDQDVHEESDGKTRRPQSSRSGRGSAAARFDSVRA